MNSIDNTTKRCLQRPAYEMAMMACEIHGIEYRRTGRTCMTTMQNPQMIWDGVTRVPCDGWQLVFRDASGEFLTYAVPGSGFINRMAKLYVSYIMDF